MDLDAEVLRRLGGWNIRLIGLQPVRNMNTSKKGAQQSNSSLSTLLVYRSWE